MPPSRRVDVDVGSRTIVTVVVVVAMVAFVVSSLSTVVSILVGTVLACGLDPLVRRLEARGWRRGRAAVAVFVALVVVVVLLVLVVGGPLWDQITAFVDNVPGYWEEIQRSDLVRELTGSGADESVKSWLQSAASKLPDAADSLLGVANDVFGSVLSLVTLFALTLYLLTERPAITDGVFALVRPEQERRWRPVLEDSINAISQSLAGNIVISVVAGTVAGVASWLLGLPYPIVLGVVAGFLDLIPQVGASIGAVVLVLVGLTVSTGAAVAILVIEVVYQQVENYVLYPLVYRRAVSLSGLTTIIAVLFGSALLGVLGALLAVPVAAAIKIVLSEATRPRRERMAALRAS